MIDGFAIVDGTEGVAVVGVLDEFVAVRLFDGIAVVGETERFVVVGIGVIVAVGLIDGPGVTKAT